MNNRMALALAAGAGYVLGRTKRADLAKAKVLGRVVAARVRNDPRVRRIRATAGESAPVAAAAEQEEPREAADVAHSGSAPNGRSSGSTGEAAGTESGGWGRR